MSDDPGQNDQAEEKPKNEPEKQHQDPSGKSDDAEKQDKSGDDEAGDDTSDKDKPDKPPIYTRPLFWVILIAVVSLIVVVWLLWWLHARQYESTDDAFVDAHIVRITPQVSGQLVWVADADNRHVKAGQLLAVIEPSGPQAQLQQAQAGVSEAEAGVQQAEGQWLAARAQRDQAAANAKAPQADAAEAARDYGRYAQLERLDKAAAAATQIDQARARAESTAGQAQAARRQIDTASAQMLVAQKQILAARAQLRAAQAKVAQANVTIGDLRLTAPIAGQVVSRNVNIGSTVSPAAQLMAIVPDRVWVTANFKETQLKLMRLGQHVDIKVDAFPDQHFSGHVDSIQRGAGQAFGILPPQNATGNYVKVVQRVPVRIVFDRMPDPQRWPIGPGMSVSPTVKVR